MESKRILNVNANPCRKIQSSASKLRTNIAELRKKIQTAKRIASAMPVCVLTSISQMKSVKLMNQKIQLLIGTSLIITF